MGYLLSDAEAAIKEGNLEKGINIINRILDKDSLNSEAMIIKALVFYKQQKWGDALNLLNYILDIDPENEKAKNYKQMVMNILSFWNKDSYNP